MDGQNATSRVGSGLVTRDPKVSSGALVFAGTRVFVATLWQYFASGESLATFLDDYPSVTREQARGVIDLAGELFEERFPSHEGPFR